MSGALRWPGPALAAALVAGAAGLSACCNGKPTAAGPADLSIAVDAAAAVGAAPPPAPRPTEAVVVSVAGVVERMSGERGTWDPLKAGDRVRADDSVRTQSLSKADLEVGDRARMTVTEESQITVAELTQLVHRLKLKRGRVAVDYQADGERVLRVEGEGGGLVAEAKSARFSARSAEGGFAVATETGTVNLKAAGAVVAVSAGEQANARPNEAPSPARPIPVSLLLKVAHATRAPGRELCAAVEGTADPGSEVLVDGVLVPVAADGRFSARVPRTLGRKDVRVVTRDALGRSREELIACADQQPSTRPDSIDDFKVRWRE